MHLPLLSSLTTRAYYTHHAHARPLHPEALAFVPYGIVLRSSSLSSAAAFASLFFYGLRFSRLSACRGSLRGPPGAQGVEQLRPAVADVVHLEEVDGAPAPRGHVHGEVRVPGRARLIS